MSLAVFDAEAGTDNTTLTTGNTGFAAVSIGASATATFEATGALFGALSYQLVHPSGSNTNVRIDPAGYSSFYRLSWAFSISALPPAGQTPQVLYFTNTANATIIALVAINSAGQLVVQNSGVTILTSTMTVTPGVTYLLDIVLDVGTTSSNGRFGLGMVALGDSLSSTNGASNVYVWTAAANLGTTGIGRVLIGKMNTTWAATQRFEIAVDDTTDFTSDPATWLRQFEPAPTGGVQFVAAGTSGSASGPSGVATAGLPAGVQHGDVLVMVVGTSRGTVSGSATFSASTLWESFQTRGANNGSTNTAINWSTHIYAPGDPSTYTATLAAGEAANTSIECFILAFRNVDLASLTWMGGVSAGSASTNAVASTTVTPPAATMIDNHDGAMALALVSALGNGGPYTTPAGWSVGKKDENSLGPIGNTLEAYYRSYSSSASVTDAPAITGTTSTKAGHQIVLNAARPAQVGTGARVRGASNSAAHWATATMPVNKPEGTVTDDLMIAVASLENAGNPADLLAPAGWTEFANGSTTGAGGAGYYKAWWRFAAAGEGDSYTWAKGTDAGGIVGIISFFNAGVPTRLTYVSSGTATGTPALDPVAGGGEADAQLLGVMLVGNGTDGYRSLATPTGMTEWADDRPPIQGGWNALAMWTLDLTSTAATGTRTTTLLTQTSSVVAPASGATATYAGVAMVVPAGGQGTLAQTGSGTLALGGKPDAAGTLARTGSGALALGGGLTTVGSLDRTGSGALTLGGVPRPVSSLARDGSGTATFGISAMTARGTLAQTGLGSLTIAGGGGAGALPRSGSGDLSLSGVPRPAQLLAITGSGTTTLGPTKVTAGGLLARTGSGVLALVGKPAMFGSMLRTGSGQLNLVKAGMTTRLQGWDAALAQWRPILVQGWDALAAAWKTVAGRRASVPRVMTPVAGSISSDGGGPAGVFTLTALPIYPHRSGPTGKQIGRMIRGPGGWGGGAYLAADLPAGPTIPAGTWFEVTWWERTSAAATMTWHPVRDDGGLLVAAPQGHTTSTEWTLRTFKAKSLVDWTPAVQRFAASIVDAPGWWAEISDAAIRTWT